MATVRFNTSLDEHILDYLDNEAKRIGVSRGGMISFMIEQYKTQKESVAMVNNMQLLIEQIQNGQEAESK